MTSSELRNHRDVLCSRKNLKSSTSRENEEWEISRAGELGFPAYTGRA